MILNAVALVAAFFLIIMLWGAFINYAAQFLLYDGDMSHSLCKSCSCSFQNSAAFIAFYIFTFGFCFECKSLRSWHDVGIFAAVSICCTTVYFLAPLYLGLYGIGYAVYATALFIATRTDTQSMLIPTLATLWMVPVGIVFAMLGLLQITMMESLLGIAFGAGLLWFVGFLFERLFKKQGVGLGDLHLLAMIGAFTGPIGAWGSVMIGSFFGSLYSLTYLFFSGKGRETRIPFGPFLAIGGLLSTLFYNDILMFFLI